PGAATLSLDKLAAAAPDPKFLSVPHAPHAAAAAPSAAAPATSPSAATTAPATPAPAQEQAPQAPRLLGRVSRTGDADATERPIHKPDPKAWHSCRVTQKHKYSMPIGDVYPGGQKSQYWNDFRYTP